MKIGLDLYGVIANHLAEKAKFASRQLGVVISENEATREAMIARLGEEGYRAFARSFSSRPLEHRLEMPLYPGVKENLAALQIEGARFALVSMRHTMELAPFVQQYVRQRHQLPIEDIVVVTSDEGKVDACRQLGVTLFFDDNRSVLERLLPLGIKLVWANFYSVHDASEHRFSIAHSWDEFAVIIRALLED